MNNPLYKMMILNAKAYLKSASDEDKVGLEHLDAFKISEVLALVLGKTKEDVMSDIIRDEK